MKRSAIAVALVLVVGLAGCSSFLGLDSGPRTTDSSTTDSSTTDSSTTDATTFPKDANLAPGLTGAGVSDPEQLAFTHRQGLDGRSFTWRSTTVVTATNGTEIGRQRQTVQVGADRRRYNSSTMSSGFNGDESTQLYRTYSNSTVSYTHLETQDGRFDKSSGQVYLRGQFAMEEYYANLFDAIPTNVTGSVERDGTTLYRVVGTNETQRMAFAGSKGKKVTVTNVAMSALIDSDGRIWQFVLEYDYDFRGRSARWKRTISYEDVGTTTVERPSWLAEAKETLANETTVESRDNAALIRPRFSE